MDSAFLLDGKVYNIEVKKDSLERSFAVIDTEQPGRTLDYTIGRDIIETFYNYTMKVYPKTKDLAAYDAFYDTVSDPDYAGHGMTFPCGQETLTFQTYITQGKDKLRTRRDRNIRGLGGPSLNFTAMEPQRRW